MFMLRLVSSIVLLLLAILSIYSGGAFLLITLLFISCVAYLELANATKVRLDLKKITGLEIINIFSICVYYGVIYYFKETTYLVLVIVLNFMMNMFVYVAKFPKYNTQQVMAAFFSFIYAPIMMSFIYLTRELSVGIMGACFIFVSSWGCDTSAYVVGMLIGKRKIFPILSPKKSLEGCIGGVVGAGLLGIIVGHYFYPDGTLIIGAICAGGSIASQIGDLAASAIKRNNDIKDYGKLIPGHGGIMDRFDSVIVTAPMIYFLALLFLN